MSDVISSDNMKGSEIAIVGMSGRFPGAQTVDEFWQNLCNGVESISFFSDEELRSAGVAPDLLSDPSYVKAKPVLIDIDAFDAQFFGVSPKEAEILDPQHRLFLEHSWDAIAQAGYSPATYDGSIGVYAGVETSTYLLNNLCPAFGGRVDLQMFLGNAVDYLSTRVSYKLNLKGPSVTVQTACSTSLVAVHLAAQSLLNGECDMALAGGVSITVPQTAGYIYQDSGIASPDGHCRAFGASAQGTLFGSGLGVVLLKRLSDAIAAGDTIHAVIKGSAVNNDGALKVGYTAPSPEGQAAVITEACAIAGIHPETLTYLEAHGTGTALGDPIELAALTQAFRQHTDKAGFCALGSVKTNFGHLSVAAGITGLIKTVLSLKHQQIPPSLHFEQPNPQIDFANSPFYVNTTLAEWPTDQHPRRAGVSSFGMGGTNAHIVLEAAPPLPPSTQSRPWQLVRLSAKTASALEQATADLAAHLKQTPDLNLADMAYTLHVGRPNLAHRRMLLCQTLDQVIHSFSSLPASSTVRNRQAQGQPLPSSSTSHIDETLSSPAIAFMFSGQGAQYVNMARELYEGEPTFRQHIDRGSELLKSHLGLDLRHIFYPDLAPAAGQVENAIENTAEAAAQQLKQTALAQPALFLVEYALAQLWQEWGVQPVAMIGHSIGEYVAATLAGVFDFESALALVAARGALMQQLPAGSMLALPLTEADVQPLLGQSLSLAVINGASACVVSGPTVEIERFQQKLAAQGVDGRLLHTSHAFHSAMMEPILTRFTQRVSQVSLSPPQRPFVSNVTGTWITAQDATDPAYWARHLRQTVRFADGLQTLLHDPRQILLEVGPGRTLTTLAKRHPDRGSDRVILASMRHPQDDSSDLACLLNTVGQLWVSGVSISDRGFYRHERRRRIPLPTYPFERQRYWIEPPQASDRTPPVSPDKKLSIADWFYLPSWKPSVLPQAQAKAPVCDLVFVNHECCLGDRLVQRLEQQNPKLVCVQAGAQFAQVSDRRYTINPQSSEDYLRLLKVLCDRQNPLQNIVHLWTLDDDPGSNGRNVPLASVLESVQKVRTLGFDSLLSLAQALMKQMRPDVADHPVQITVISNRLQSVIGNEDLSPAKALLLGPVRVIPQEYPHIRCRSLDVTLPLANSWQAEKLTDRLLCEIGCPITAPVLAYRGQQRYSQTVEPVKLENTSENTSKDTLEALQPLAVRSRLRNQGVYLITGGLGHIGLILARYLAETVQAKLILTGRSALPDRAEWESWLASHDEQDPICRKIAQSQALEALGADVMVRQADVANLSQMQETVLQAEQQFGPLNGVIHAAGVVGAQAFTAIAQTDKAACDQQFQPKVDGLLVLDKVLQNQPLDFCMMVSSLSSVLGGLGYAAYAAANLFVDAFTHQHNQRSAIPWLSVNWDAWEGDDGSQESALMAAKLGQFLIKPAEGISAFQRILTYENLTQIIVSTGDLRARLDQWLTLGRSADQSADKSAAPPTFLHARPALQADYAAPEHEIEKILVDVFQQVLGIEPVGIYDSFFDLGGDSMMGIQLISKIRSHFQVELLINHLFEAPCVADLALKIEAILIEEILAKESPSPENTPPEETTLENSPPKNSPEVLETESR